MMSLDTMNTLPTIMTTASYWICFTPRSGSEFISDLLRRTGKAGNPDELFWVHRDILFEKIITYDELFRCVHRIVAAGSSENGIFSVKIATDHVPSLKDYYALTSPLPKCVLVSRRDKVRQAVSWAMAKQTNVWWQSSADASEVEVEYRREEIEALIGHISKEEARWEAFFSSMGIQPLRIWYEEFIQQPQHALRDVLDFIGVSAVECDALPEPALVRQANGVSESWVRRYRAEIGEASGRGGGE